MAMSEMEKLHVVCCACFVQCGVILVAKNTFIHPQLLSRHTAGLDLFLFTNCSRCFFSERQTELSERVRSAYCSDNTKAGLVTMRDILLFCESLTRLFNRISVDKAVL